MPHIFIWIYLTRADKDCCCCWAEEYLCEELHQITAVFSHVPLWPTQKTLYARVTAVPAQPHHPSATMTSVHQVTVVFIHISRRPQGTSGPYHSYNYPHQEAKYVERWPNTTSAWAGWSRFDIPVDRYGGVYSLLICTSSILVSATCHQASQQDNTYWTKYQKADRASTLCTLCIHISLRPPWTLHNRPQLYSSTPSAATINSIHEIKNCLLIYTSLKIQWTFNCGYSLSKDFLNYKN